MDRFVIGALISVKAVAYYGTPFELVTKLLFLPAAILAVFFPAFAATYAQDSERTAMMFDRANRLVMIGMFPAVLVFVAYAREILLFWVGPDYTVSTTIMQLLAIGVLVNSIAQVPVHYLQAVRRADLTAKLHLAEFPLYVGLIAVLGMNFGITGIALAWTLRVSIDTVALCWLSRRQLANLIPGIDRMLVWLGGMTVMLLLITLPASLPARIALGGLTLIAFTVLAWKSLLSPAERAFALSAMPWGPRVVRLDNTGD
jgi:O-antigen/teichoic acid export membrane protein